MATKVKPCRIKATGTPQVGYVPKYVDEDTFQWGAGGGGGGSDIVYATQAEYNALLPGAASDGKHYFIYSTSGGGGWQPGVNTVLYVPMQEDLLNHSSTSVTITNTGGVGIVTGVADIPVAQFNNASKNLTFTNPYSMANQWTISIWEKIAAQNTNGNFFMGGTPNAKKIFHFGYTTSSTRGLTVSNFYTDIDTGNNDGRDNTWHNITVTYTGIPNQSNNIKIYIDGSLKTQGTTDGWGELTNNTFYIGNYQTDANLDGYLSNVILESVVWTDQEISDYYDLTKGDYGIS